ncbi:hypothetical protein ATANTOWER_024811 [Ataeniobius toweri]|uniref:Secreted protein n=1 Tax=Ataeniobius toweri TaxID=208326 RepID=A0ABU7BTE4_9TELE|nr:hypothetical protein [Ataeniobius toweri]
MFRARVHHWLKVLHCASPTKSLHLLPGTCKPKEGTSVFCRSPTCKTPSCPPSNFTYTSWKETHRNNNHLTTTSPVKLSLCGVTHLPLETPFLPNRGNIGRRTFERSCLQLETLTRLPRN